MEKGRRSSAGDNELYFKSVSLNCALEKTRVVGQKRSASHSRKGANLYDSIKFILL
jgi:hypothetical protein